MTLRENMQRQARRLYLKRSIRLAKKGKFKASARWFRVALETLA